MPGLVDQTPSAQRRIWQPLAGAWRRFRALRIALYALLGFEVVYVVGAAIFLNFNLLPLAFASTNQIKATVASGWSVFPGRVHVKKVRLTFEDHNLQFSIDIAHATIDIHLLELTQHVFHASHLRGDGVAFHLRHRVEPWSKNDPAVGAFAPFPEFPGPAVFEPYVPEPPIPDAKYNLWTVHMDDVDVGVSEAWAQAFRYRGKGRAKGQFELKPARRLWVGPASLELEPGILTAGAYRVAPGLHGHIDCTVHPFDVRVPQGMAVFRYISAHIRLDSPELDPQVVALFAGENGPQISAQHGSLHLDVETKHGVFTPESRVEIVQRELELRTPELEVDADRVVLGADMEGASDSAVTLEVERALVKEPTALGFPPFVAHAQGALVSDNRDVAQDFHFKSARLDDARVALTDARWLNRWLKSRGFELSGGGASVLARAKYENSQLEGQAVLETNGVGATLGAKHVRYTGALAVQVEHVDPKAMTGSVAVDLDGRALRGDLGNGEIDLAGLRARVLARRDEAGDHVRGQARLTSLSTQAGGLTLRAPEVLAVADSETRADGTELTHFTALLPALSAEGREVRLTSAALARGVLAQPKNKPEKRLDFEATLLKPAARFGAAPVKTAATSRVVVRGQVRTDAAGALSGDVRLMPAAWRVDAANMRFQGESALDLKLAELNLGAHSGQFAAQLSSNGVTVGDTTQNANCAWSRVQALELDAKGKLLPRDATDISLTGELGQAELSWGDFTTRADIGLAAHFTQGLFGEDGAGTVDLNLRHATIQSGDGGKEGWSAVVPALAVSSELTQKAGKLTGALHVSADAAQGRIGGTIVKTDLDAKLLLDSLNLNGRTAHATGEVKIRNASLPTAAEPVKNWWANVHLDSLNGHAEQNLELGGMFRAELRDATPALAVLGEQGSLPKWVQTAFPLRDLSITGSLARRCRLTDIHLVNLSGGPAVARGRLQSLPDGFQGAVLLRLAGFQAISAGLDFDSKHTHVGLFDGDGWLAESNRSLDVKSNDAVKLVCPPDPDKCMAPSADDSEMSSREPGAREEKTEQASWAE